VTAPILIPHRRLHRVVQAIIRAHGSDEREAELVADHLVRADLSGHASHGTGLIPTYVAAIGKGLLVPGTAALPIRDDGPFLAFDGRRGYGQRVGHEAMEAAIERCRETGIVVMALRSAHHLGRIGAYGEQSIAAGLISLHFANVIDHDPFVAPFGGREARYGTNPLCMAMPGTADTPPLLLDMATSAIAVGKVRVATETGARVPAGSLQGPGGEPATDPAVLFGEPPGSLLPCGGHKGSGLALFCELLAGVLTRGGTIHPGNPRQGSIVNNMLTFVLDPARLGEHDWMAAEIDAVVRYVREAPPPDGGGPVMVAGEPERLAVEERSAKGVPLAAGVWEDIRRIGAEAGVERSLLESWQE